MIKEIKNITADDLYNGLSAGEGWFTPGKACLSILVRGQSKEELYYKELLLPDNLPEDDDYFSADMTMEWLKEKIIPELIEWCPFGVLEIDTGSIELLDTCFYVGGIYDFDVITHYMYDDIREQLSNELAPCTNFEFIEMYLARHLDKYGEEFKIN